MGNILKLVFIILSVTIVGAGVFLATWDIPAPSSDVETVIDDSQFPS